MQDIGHMVIRRPYNAKWWHIRNMPTAHESCLVPEMLFNIIWFSNNIRHEEQKAKTQDQS